MVFTADNYRSKFVATTLYFGEKGKLPDDNFCRKLSGKNQI